MPETLRPHILVVDDDPQIRALLDEYLTENELRVSAVSNSAQMTEILAAETIDLVVLDLRLAGEDGMAIARTLRDQSSVPIVMLTAVRDGGRSCHGSSTWRRRLPDQTVQPPQNCSRAFAQCSGGQRCRARASAPTGTACLSVRRLRAQLENAASEARPHTFR